MNELTMEQLIARVAELEAAATHTTHDGLGLRVSAKGGVSVYGIGRFPVTLYRSQWDKLLANAPRIADFITANADKLASKPAKE